MDNPWNDLLKWWFLFSFSLSIILGVGFRIVEEEEGSEHEGRHDGKAFKAAIILGLLASCFKTFNLN
tara:strand:- start:279 stop:479 length:201 start_codon:yes stop_codon:yes gene_type:complete